MLAIAADDLFDLVQPQVREHRPNISVAIPSGRAETNASVRSLRESARGLIRGRSLVEAAAPLPRTDRTKFREYPHYHLGSGMVPAGAVRDGTQAHRVTRGKHRGDGTGI